MVLLYTSYGCASCRKAKEWLKERNIPYVEKNIFSTLLNDDELKLMLKRSGSGFDDLISRRSKVITENNIDIDSMTTDQMINFVKQNPSVLRRPIILDEKKFQVGYDAEEIEVFTPKELRRACDDACNPRCPNYQICGGLRKSAPGKETDAD